MAVVQQRKAGQGQTEDRDFQGTCLTRAVSKSCSVTSVPATSVVMDPGGQSGPFRPALRVGNRFDPVAADRPIVVFEDAHKAYRADAPVLKGFCLEVRRGEFVFITGPSGSGKSTLLRLLYAAEQVDAGRILFMGRDVGRLGARSIPFLRRNVGVVFQDFKLVQNWTVLQNVVLPLEVLGIPQRLMRRRVGEALERVGLGGGGADRAECLSGG